METAKNIQEVALDEKESRLRQKGFARKIKKNTHTQVALTGLPMYGINSKSNGVGVVYLRYQYEPCPPATISSKFS